MSNDDPVRTGISRRDAIRRAAIAGGVIAWTAPTIQVLGSGTTFATEVGTDVEPCTGGTKIGAMTLQWVGGSCATFGLDTGNQTNNLPTADCVDNVNDICPPCSNCICTDSGGCSTAGLTYITLSNGASVTSAADVFGGGSFVDQFHVFGPLGFSFVFQNGSNLPTFSISKNADGSSPCQVVGFHSSCSKSPPSNGPVRPDYQLGGLLVTDWSVGSGGMDMMDMPMM